MVKKIGNSYLYPIIALIGLFLDIQNLSAVIRLSITDISGKALQQIGLGVPFLIEIEAHVNTSDRPQLHSDYFTIKEQGTSQYTTIINGRSQIKKHYRYVAKAKQAGTFELGPATLEINGSREESNTLTIEVGDRPVNTQNDQQGEPIQVHLCADKSQAYVGEKINIKLRIYFFEPVEINSLLAPDIADVYIYDAGKPIKGKQKIKNGEYEYIEQGLEIYPKNPGQLYIPAATVLCNVPVKHGRQEDFFSSIFTMFGVTSEQKFYSNGLNVTIKPIPAHERKINAVGQFSRYEGAVDHNKAQQGEGIVFTLSVHGDGDLEHIEWPEIQLPEGLRAYESKSFLVSENIKKFEYILQGEKSGSFLIPKQLFTYFDPEITQFNTLSSNSIELEIANSDKKTEELIAAETKKKIYEEQKKTSENYSLVTHEDHFLTLNYFLLLLLLPFMYPFFYVVTKIYKKISNKLRYVKKRSFKKAYRLIQECQTSRSDTSLYDIFCTLFAETTETPLSEISPERVERFLKTKNVDHAAIEQWNHFFKLLLQQKFCATERQELLIKQAYEWLKRLEAII